MEVLMGAKFAGIDGQICHFLENQPKFWGKYGMERLKLAGFQRFPQWKGTEAA
jgi:hypothetical protein